MAGEPFRVAIVGGGRMGQVYMETYSRLPSARLVAVVDPNADRRAAVSQLESRNPCTLSQLVLSCTIC